MSTIDPRLNSALPSSFDALERQARLDSGLDAGLDAELVGLAGAEEALRQEPELTSDIAVLMAEAEGPGTFDIGSQQATLSQLDRGEAVDQGVDDIVASLG